MVDKRSIRIKVPVLARVEGEGALDIHIDGEEITKLALKIYEPPRLFEKLLEGREFHEIPDMVARICGICPVAYQMSAVQALEQIFACKPGDWVKQMRRVFYCGEWIQSHALHIHLLAAPDLLGYASAPEMSRDHPEIVRRGLRIQALGNEIIRLLGGRSVHPVGACVGGFHAAPANEDVSNLIGKLREAQTDTHDLLAWTASLKLPVDEQSFTSVALHHPSEYPMNEGRLHSSDGLDIPIEDYEQHFREFQVPWSTALHSVLDEKPYLVGPLARLNLNYEHLDAETISQLNANGISLPSKNMFHSIVARAAEINYAVNETLRILENYQQPDQSCADVQTRSGSGYGCTEAPRGILWHRYETDESGNIRSARIVPPTSQNQARIEEDIKISLQTFGLDHTEEELKLRAETVIRNYDPCISCATHFLTLAVDRVS